MPVPRPLPAWKRSCSRAFAATLPLALAAAAAAGDAPAPRCIVVEAFASERDDAGDAAIRGVEEFAAGRRGVVVVRRFLDASERDRADLARLATRRGFDPARLPVFTACGAAIAGVRDPEAAVARLRSALQVEVFVREGCGRCTRAKAWLAGVRDRYQGLEIALCDLTHDAGARSLLAELVRVHKVAAASVPVFHLGGRLEVGFDRAETTGKRLEAILEGWTCPCPAKVDGSDDDAFGVEADQPVTVIDLPFLGSVDLATLGMPVFTVAVGLVDGFNPCAMWVLLLLLAVLVNLHDRIRMLAIAGTFVLVSGAAYFAFMAAWLNVFEWIGCLRPVQIALGLLAIFVGAIHVKDFFAFHAGVSLSIPEAAKPGIYQRIRRIVTAENLTGAVVGAFVLAVLVNVVELLCTAGLPALYTNILSQQGFSSPVRYGYLGLYILAYMFDDAVMVTAVVATLSRFKLQETGGRWLKLVSGGVILLLGLVMLLRPEWID